MKYLKTFELFSEPSPGTGRYIDYEVGDTVTCIEDFDPFGKKTVEKGEKFKVTRIWQTPEDKFLGNPYLRVDLISDTGKVLRGMKSTMFTGEIETEMDKYNL